MAETVQSTLADYAHRTWLDDRRTQACGPDWAPGSSGAGLLGEGASRGVYQARPADGAAQQPAGYAVKVLRKEWWRDPQAIDMQRREAWVGAKASHPNLLPVLSASVKEPPFYLVSPKLDGATLEQILVEQGPLDVPLALWIAPQAADGLAELLRRPA